MQKLEQMDEREAARKLEYLVDHVEKEIDSAEEKLMNLESAGYDMNYILQQQEELKRKYAKKIREMNDKNAQYRYRGSGNYANYSFTDDDDDEDFEMYKAPMPDHRRYGRYY